MKKSKVVKASKGEDGIDMISNMPDHILQLILSRLQGTEEVFRTSILSTRWKHLWTSVPSIDIDYTRRMSPLEESKRRKFREFVYWVLLNKPLDLDSFRLCCGNYYSMSTIRQWINAAVMRKVKLLDLRFCPKEESGDIELPHCPVTCGSLEVLRLCLMGCRLCLPKITGFSALRVLELNDVDLDDDDDNDVVKYFLESCPLLEDLSLIDCNADSLVISCPKLKNLRIDIPVMGCDSLEICCPKLEFLKLTGDVADKYLFQSLDSLKKAVIYAQGFFEVKPPFDFFASISHVEYLSISVYCISEFFDIEGHSPISLHNLKTLEITLDGIHSNMHALIPFLKCLPDLDSLHLIIPKDAYGLDKLDLEEADTINILTRHLKKVEFLEFDGKKLRLDVARALLKDGNLLEEMVFSWADEARLRSMKTMKKVSKFQKASSTVKLTAVINPTQPNYRKIKLSSRG